MDIVTGAMVIAGLKYVGQPSAELVKDFIGRILAPPADAIGAIAAHPIVEWQKRRVERGEQVVEHASVLVQQAGKEPKAVPGRLLLSILEHSSVEEEPDLSRAWVALLANASISPTHVLPAFPKLLSELSPLEARLLQYLYDIHVSENRTRSLFPNHLHDERRLDTDKQQLEKLREARGDREIRYRLGIDSSDIYNVITENVERMSLIRRTPDYGDAPEKYEGHSWGISLTTLGQAFVKACRPPLNRREAK